MKVDVDKQAGFCFGVVEAIRKAEEILDAGEKLYSLGEIVHNEVELHRLEQKGLKHVTVADFPQLEGKQVLIRAHGEPPETYRLAKKYNISLLEATCPIVLKLQQRIRKENQERHPDHLVIFGKANHPEAIGLAGQAAEITHIVENKKDIEELSLEGSVSLYSQTTMDAERFEVVKQHLRSRMKNPELLQSHNTICGQMKRRKPALKEFAASHDVVIFVSGKNSSNGRFLFSVVRQQNPQSYFVSSAGEINPQWFLGINSVGVSGATSTPQWLLEEVAEKIRQKSGRVEE